MRLFFALWPNAAVRRALRFVQQRVAAGGARAVQTDYFHITLAFLGEVPDDRLPALLPIRKTVACPHVTQQLNRLGWFERAAVSWLGCNAVPVSLQRMQSRLAEHLVQLGFIQDAGPWLPHVTLYRKMRTPPDKLSFDAVEWQVEDYVLVRSVLTPDGPDYRLIGLD